MMWWRNIDADDRRINCVIDIWNFPVLCIGESPMPHHFIIRPRRFYFYAISCNCTKEANMPKGKYYPRKFVNFNPDDKEDMKLYNELKRLGHGEFSEGTKEYWRKRLKESGGFGQV